MSAPGGDEESPPAKAERPQEKEKSIERKMCSFQLVSSQGFAPVD